MATGPLRSGAYFHSVASMRFRSTTHSIRRIMPSTIAADSLGQQIDRRRTTLVRTRWARSSVCWISAVSLTKVGNLPWHEWPRRAVELRGAADLPRSPRGVRAEDERPGRGGARSPRVIQIERDVVRHQLAAFAGRTTLPKDASGSMHAEQRDRSLSCWLGTYVRSTAGRGRGIGSVIPAIPDEREARSRPLSVQLRPRKYAQGTVLHRRRCVT